MRCANLIPNTLHLDIGERIKKAQQFIDEHYNKEGARQIAA
jgi:hypothetical protein